MSENDRELLDLAAKAAGVRRELMDNGEPFYIGASTNHAWNPLAYDGDALRLAVELRMVMDISSDNESGRVFATAAEDHSDVFIEEAYAPDPCAAARRAIVRAAAEIGRAME